MVKFLPMAYPVYLGIDFGTSGARACVIAHNGEIEEFARLDFGHLAALELASGWREVMFQLLASLPIGLRKRLAALAVDGTSATILACDESLNPAHAPLLYNDNRARAEAESISLVSGTGHPAATPTSGLAKVLWLAPHLAPSRLHRFLNQADWLTALLSGLPGISDYHNALKMGFEPAASKWPAWVARLADMQSLPNVVPPGSPIGALNRLRARELGIPVDCIVRAGTTDSTAAFLAAGVHEIGDAVTSLGTTLAIKLVSERRVADARLGVYSHWYGNLWLAGGASNAGGGALLQHFSEMELTNLSAQIEPSSDSGLDYYPLPSRGERFPVNDPDLVPRLEPRPMDRVRFLHGMLEGLANIEARGYAALAALGATPVRRVLSCGGGARNAVYGRIRERQLRVPVTVAPQQDAAYGCALLARDGSSLFPGFRND